MRPWIEISYDQNEGRMDVSVHTKDVVRASGFATGDDFELLEQSIAFGSVLVTVVDGDGPRFDFCALEIPVVVPERH